jgi:anaerobic magnesium-protoporphyrin IX monomethyl ester cyclase
MDIKLTEANQSLRKRRDFARVVDCLFINPQDMLAAIPYVKSLTYIAVLEEAGFKVELIDPVPHKKSVNDIVDYIANESIKIICISAVPSSLPFAYRLSKGIRERVRDAIIILEGYHVNADPDIILEMGIDYGLLGDAEFTMLELCSVIMNEHEVDEHMPGLVINHNGTAEVNKSAFIKDLDVLPMPAFHKMAIGKYYSASTNKTIMYMFTSRGCPFECNFCTNPLQKNFRHLSVERTLEQLEHLVYHLSVEWIEFMDLTFTTSRKLTIELCNEIVKQGIKFSWGCETRADLVDRELLIAMKNAGCEKITFGVESGNENVRFGTGKKITNKQFVDAFSLCKEVGIKTMANFIIGHPDETEDQVNESISFARKLDPFNVLYIRMTPLPDVDIYEDGVRTGQVDPEVWVKYMKGGVAHPIYYPSSLPRRKAEWLFKKALFNHYFRWSTIRKYLPLFVDIRYFIKSIRIFLLYTFGQQKFK